ncbi:MAG TPA: amidase family protein, partial [Pseudonocardia sp.]|nr:amidase family protein [Pseudonocardia sp.]
YATHAAWLAERPGDYQPATRERLEPFAAQPAREYVQALRTRTHLVAAMRTAVGDVDVLVLPTTRLRATPIGAPAVEIGGRSVPVRPALLALTLPFNLTGWPAVSVPFPAPDAGAGGSEFAGLPLGVQVVGVRFEERGVLRVAGALTGA